MQLGDKVRDVITGFEGVVTGHVVYLTGCNQALVQPPCKADGDFQSSRWFDDDRLEVIEAQAVTLNIKNAGPDTPAPVR